MKEPKFILFMDTMKQYRFRLVAPNGKTILQSEAYKTKQSCYVGIRAVAKYAIEADVVERISV
jgi:uncharacterized protein YegP (UPF0339 family)